MADVPTFVLPAAANLSVGANTLSIQHDGDVVLGQSLGRRLARVESGGDVTVTCKATGALIAAGTLTISGDADAEELRGDVVVLDDGAQIRARAVVATTRIEVRAAKLAVDILCAPEVLLHEAASGRVRIVDALNEQPPTRVRGCLSLDDYEADFGDVAGFLDRRGVTPVSPLPEPRDDLEDTAGFDAVKDADDDTEAVAVAEVEEIIEAEGVEELGLEEPPTSVTEEAPAPAPAAKKPRRRPPAPTPQPQSAEAARPGQSRTARQLQRAWTELAEAYGSADLPVAVTELGTLIEDGRHVEATEGIDVFWRETLREHLVRGQTPPLKATMAFHGIRSLAA